MGQTKDDPSPRCPHCGEPDSQLHFVQECPVALHVRHTLVGYWMVWRPAVGRDTLLSWWNDEVAPKCPDKDDWNKEHQLRSAFMASWVMLVHGLYRHRVATAVANRDRRDLPRTDAEFRQAAALVVAAWKQELRSLLWAYAYVNMDMPSECMGIDRWRASFALFDWYRDIPGSRNIYNQHVAIAFPDELVDGGVGLDADKPEHRLPDEELAASPLDL
jgi:hypothetical protein